MTAEPGPEPARAHAEADNGRRGGNVAARVRRTVGDVEQRAGHALRGAMERPPLVAICGAGDATEQNERDAEEVGRLLAERGAVVICGGFEGVMCAAARGAGRGNGLSIGLLAGDEPDAAADEVTIALPTGLGELANAVLPRMVHGVVAIGQGYGTLTEVAHAIKLGRPVVGLGSWEIRGADGSTDDAVHPAGSPQEAVEWLLDELRRRSRNGARRTPPGQNPADERTGPRRGDAPR